MSNPIDATLAAFITQAIREAIAEERRQYTYERRRGATREERRRSSREERCCREQCQRTVNNDSPRTTISAYSDFTFRPPTSTIGATSNPYVFQWPMTANTTVNSTNTLNTKKVNIVEPNTEPESTQRTQRTQSRYAFARPSTATTSTATTSNTNTSNSVANMPQPTLYIPNQDKPINLILGMNNILKPNMDVNSQANKNTTPVEPVRRPPQPSYPPPVYQGPPGLISDEETPDAEPPRSRTEDTTCLLSGLFNATLGQDYTDRDSINGILTGLLVEDMTKELENIADDFKGTPEFEPKLMHSVSNPPFETNPHSIGASATTTTASDKPTNQPPTITARDVRDAISSLDASLASENVRRDVRKIIIDYLVRLMHKPRFGHQFQDTNFNPETDARVAKAICAELSISNRLAAIEDMIKNL